MRHNQIILFASLVLAKIYFGKRILMRPQNIMFWQIKEINTYISRVYLNCLFLGITGIKYTCKE